MTRPTILDTMLDTADTWAKRGTCSRLKVGAVLAHGNHPAAIGYNGAPKGMDHCVHRPDDGPCKVAVHAEVNAVADAARRGVRIDGATCFSTHAPCLACASLLINAGVTMVVYRREFRSKAGLELLVAAGLIVMGPAG